MEIVEAHGEGGTLEPPLVPPDHSLWGRLGPELVQHIADQLDPNEVAGTMRLLNKEVKVALHGSQHRTISLSRPFPKHAFAAYWLGPGGSITIPRLLYWQRQRLVRAAALLGDVAALQAVLRAGCPLPDAYAIELAAAAGHVQACGALIAAGYSSDPPSLLRAAARAGQGHVCEWLLAAGHCHWSEQAVSAAALSGHMSLCNWLIELKPQGEKWRVRRRAVAWKLEGTAWGWALAELQWVFREEFGRAAASAVARGDVAQGDQQQPSEQQQQQMQQEGQEQEQGQAGQQMGQHPGLLQWPKPVRKCLRMCIQGGVLAAAAGSPTADWAAKVEWLEGLGFRKTQAVLAAAAAVRSDGTARLDWLQARGGYPPPNKDVANAAAIAGNAAAVKQLLAAGVWPEWLIFGDIGAAGHVEVLQALKDAGYRKLSYALCLGDRVEQTRRPEVVEWVVEAIREMGLVEHDPDSNPEEAMAWHFSWAARSGSVALASSLRERGYPWSGKAYEAAASAGSAEMLEWLAEKGCPKPTDGSPYRAACSSLHSDLPTLRCLRNLGLVFGDDHTFLLIAQDSSGHREDRLSSLRWLLAEGCPVDWARVRELQYVPEEWKQQVLALAPEQAPLEQVGMVVDEQ